MEWFVTRFYDAGRLMERHQRVAGRVRGKLAIGEEHEPKRGRTTLVARLTDAKTGKVVPSLYDVRIVASDSSSFTLAGYERLESGPMRHEIVLGQSWSITPAPMEDLIHAEREWNRLAQLVDAMREGKEPEPHLETPFRREA